MRTLEQLAQDIVNQRKPTLNQLAKRIVQARPVPTVTVAAPTVQVQAPEPAIHNITVPTPNVTIPKPEVTVNNQIDPTPVNVQVHVPKQIEPIVNVTVPEFPAINAPPVNVKEIIPPEAIKVEVNIPEIHLPPRPDPPKKAIIKHPNGGTSEVELS